MQEQDLPNLDEKFKSLENCFFCFGDTPDNLIKKQRFAYFKPSMKE